MVGISEFQLVLSAVIWDVLDKADFAVVDAILHEIEIVDSPSWLVFWELGGKGRKVGLTVSFILSRAWARFDKRDARVSSLWNSEDSPSELTLLECG